MSRGVLGTLRTWAYALDRRLYRAGLRDASSLPLPRFLGIGAVKSATTWLHDNLACHPALFLPEEKEVHWFDTRHQMPVRWYAEHFAACGERVPGEICPTYLALPPDRIRVVRDLLPDARFLVLLRAPRERAWSQAVMDLERFAGRPLETVEDDEIEALLRGRNLRRHGEYAAGLARWWEAFPRDRFLVRFHEDVRDRPRELLRECFAHVGVPADVEWTEFPVSQTSNPGARGRRPSPRIAAVLEELHVREVQALRPVLGDAVPAAW